MKRLLLSGAALALGLIMTSASARAAQVLIDFGGTTTTDSVGRTWTTLNTNSPADSYTLATRNNSQAGLPLALKSVAGGADTGYRMAVGNPTGQAYQKGFDDVNFGGGATTLTGTAAARNYPTSSTMNSGFANPGSFNSTIVPDVRLTFSNLNPLEKYSFDFFASRIVASPAAGESRNTEFDITGGPAGTAPTALSLEALNNTGNIVGASGFTPDANNQIVIDIKAGAGNNNNSGANLYYLNTLEINSTPEPTGLAILALGCVGFLRRPRRA